MHESVRPFIAIEMLPLISTVKYQQTSRQDSMTTTDLPVPLTKLFPRSSSPISPDLS